MLEKIGLPPKPSLRGNNWVVDASHCQGCSSQFTFINRKHHCRRCGGLFCNSCSQQRMLLRGQGDSPVRICESCKKLEEAARFEMRYGQKNRAARGASKLTSSSEDEILNQILGNDGKDLVLPGRGSANNTVSSIRRATSSASCSNTEETTIQDEGGGNLFVEETSQVQNETGSATPDELRQQAVDEKNKYKILKAEGKSEEALKAFKRGKELERQAGALELLVRKNRRKAMSSSSMTETSKIKDDDVKVPNKKNKIVPQMSKGKDDLAAELRELGWSDMDLHDTEKKPAASMSLEGELSSLLGKPSQKTVKSKGTGGIEKTQILAHKKRALELKREGNLAEAKEELKRAKVLEKQLEEQEFLADFEESDDELSTLIRSMDDDKQDDLSVGFESGPGFNFDDLLGLADDNVINSKFDVTDEDMDDPEMAAALKSLGWAEEANAPKENIVSIDRGALSHEIQSLKREALVQKRAGNTVDALALLKRAKILEKDLENYEDDSISHSQVDVLDVSERKGTDPKLGSKTKRVLQKELLELKKRALALRREGRLEEADDELKKGKVLEQQLEDMDDSSSKMKATPVNINDNKKFDISTSPILGDEVEGDVTDQDMQDPTYLSLLNNLGWKDEDDGNTRIPSAPAKQNDFSISAAPTTIRVEVSRRRSKGEIQRELLGLKRKALALRRQGQTEEAEEMLRTAKELEAQLAEMDEPTLTEVGPTDEMKFKEVADILMDANDGNARIPSVVPANKQNDSLSAPIGDYSMSPAPTTIRVEPSRRRSKGEIQRELLGLKRKALGLRRQGQIEEAEEMLRTAKELEDQLAEMDEPIGYKHPSLAEVAPTDEMKTKEVSGSNPILGQPDILMDFLTGDDLISSRTPVRNLEDTSSSPVKELVGEDNAIHVKTEENVRENLGQVNSSKDDRSSVQQDILAHKRKAVALKREGKLVEAREELRQAKLLEKSVAEDKPTPSTSSANLSNSASNFPPAQPEHGSSNLAPKPLSEHGSSNLAPKPLSGRDRFKIQQESLNHKRRAMKLRREGRTEEADAEYELAKALETQLEELTDSNKSVTVDANDEVGVESFLDPQLLSALKAIGIEDDNNIVSQVPEKPELAKSAFGKSGSTSQERGQLEERIKAEKVKAVNLKRLGKQAEALDALRRAKALEKKLNTLT